MAFPGWLLKLRTAAKRTIEILGVIQVLGWIERVLGWGEHVKFVMELAREAGGVGLAINFILDPPPALGLTVFILAAGLIWWDLRRQAEPRQSVKRDVRRVMPVVLIVIGALLIVTGVGWLMREQRNGDEPNVKTSAPAPSPIVPGKPGTSITQSPPVASEAKILTKQYSATDRARLDDALYKMFDIITIVEMPLQREAEVNLIQNWEQKMLSPTLGPTYFVSEIDRIRKTSTAGHQRIYDIIYKEFNYYMEELRDAAIEKRTTSFFTALDNFRVVVNALPPNPTMDQLRVLVADKHKLLAQGVEDYGRWIGDARRRIQQKRDYILTLQGTP
jgi:hypothetical protein